MGVLGFEPADEHLQGWRLYLALPTACQDQHAGTEYLVSQAPQVCTGVGAERTYRERTGWGGQSRTQSQAKGEDLEETQRGVRGWRRGMWGDGCSPAGSWREGMSLKEVTGRRTRWELVSMNTE